MHQSTTRRAHTNYPYESNQAIDGLAARVSIKSTPRHTPGRPLLCVLAYRSLLAFASSSLRVVRRLFLKLQYVSTSYPHHWLHRSAAASIASTAGQPITGF